jgi:cell division protein FtsI/penicillin-binding protein 2
MLVSFILTIVLSGLLLLLGLFLFRLAWLRRNPGADPENAADEKPGRGANAANSWLRGARTAFLLTLVVVLGFHAYWVFWASSGKDSRFARAKVLDSRNRRLAESGLKGWVLDRTGKLENALIRYRFDGKGLVREYPLGRAAVHVTGFSDFVYGAGGIEAAYRDWLTDPASTYNRIASPVPVGRDLQVSIDSDLQRELFKLIEATGKPAAAVVLSLPANEVLAMASTPSFDPLSIQDESSWRGLSEQAQDPATQPLSPLVNRALGTIVTGGPAFYYRPGSTFKTFIAAVALDTGITGEHFTCRAQGFTPPGSGHAIQDFAGEVHGTMGLKDAFRVSCNQYFSQLGLKLGKQRLADYARRLRYLTDPDDAGRTEGLWQITDGHGQQDRFDFVFAPPAARMNLEAAATAHDVALQSFGQGFDDFTVLSMALLTAAVASGDGALTSPTFEHNAQRKVLSPFISGAAAGELRTMMRSVVESGTAAGAFNSRFAVAGKTGTADRDVLVYDKQGQPVTFKDDEGRARMRTQGWTDSWFVGFAPADKPRIAFAVVVENGGQGAKTAAPIAARLVEKCAARNYYEAAASSSLASK